VKKKRGSGGQKRHDAPRQGAFHGRRFTYTLAVHISAEYVPTLELVDESEAISKCRKSVERPVGSVIQKQPLADIEDGTTTGAAGRERETRNERTALVLIQK